MLTHTNATLNKFAFCLLIISSLINLSLADNQIIDSLKLVLKKLPEDTSKVNTLIKIGNQYDALGEHSKIDPLASEALKLSEKLNYKKGMADSYFGIGLAAFARTEYDTSLEEYNSALKLYKEINDSIGIASVNSNIGVIYTLQSNYSEALKNMLEAIKIREVLGIKESAPKSYSMIGSLYRMLGEYQKSIEYHLKSLKLYEVTNNQVGVAKCYTNIGNTYRLKGNLREALNWGIKGYELNREMKNEGSIAKSSHNIGEIYLLLGIEFKEKSEANDSILKYFELADKYMSESLKLSVSLGDRTTAAANYLDLGLLLLQEGKASKAKESLIKAQKLNITTNNRDFLKDNYIRLARADSAMGNFKGAFENHKIFTLYKDSLFNEENIKEITQQQMQFEFDKKEQVSREEQEKKNLLSENELQMQKKMTILFIIITMMLLIVGFLIYSRNKLSRKTEHQAAELKKLNEIELIRDRISRDLHDDIGSTLSSINILSHLEEKDQSKREIAIRKIGERSVKMMEAMDDIVWAVNPVNDAFDNMIVRMREYTAETLEAKNIDYLFNAPVNISDIKMDMGKRRDLFLIFKEAINNLAKYSECSQAEINLVLANNTMQLKIKDNGKGFDVKRVNGGNGLVNLKKRSENLNAELSIIPIVDKGTEISLNLPIT